MDSLKELVKHLQSLPNGASMGELKEVLADEYLLKTFVKAGLDSESIFSEGKKRGTRYFAKGKVPIPVSEKPEKKKDEVEEYADTLEHSELEAVLKSDKAIPGHAVFTKMIKFGKDDNLLSSFFKAGMVIEQSYVSYDKVQKRNIVIQKVSRTIYNKMGIKQIGRKFIIQKYNTHTGSFEVENIDDYESLRETLRILLSGAK